MEVNKLKRINIVLLGIILILVILIIVVVLLYFKNFNSKEIKEENNSYTNNTSDITSLDNSEYIGIYSYNDSESECSDATTLVLTKNYDAIFYIGNCEIKSYYIGSYYIKDNIIYLYDLVLEDSSNLQEEDIEEIDIHFNIVDSSKITSIFGRSSSITLNKLYNVV